MEDKIFTTKPIDFNAKHVVFKGKDGKTYFAEKSSNYHAGLEVIKECDNFYEADRVAKSNKNVVS